MFLYFTLILDCKTVIKHIAVRSKPEILDLPLKTEQTERQQKLDIFENKVLNI